MGFIKSSLLGFIRLTVMIAVFSHNPLYPQQSSQKQKEEFDALSLEEMLDVKISVASKTSMTQRESPGIISVITQAEIINSGARDLSDVLLMVPGFMLASDVQNTVGAGIRGSWAHEGKVLLLLDGQEFNETIYSTLQFGNHFPLEHISRIEIIRGPGSATYGGYAELGVINIITRSAEEVNGVSAALSFGQMDHAYARRTMSLSFGKQGKDFSLVAHTFFGQGNRSDQVYTDVYGNSFNMNGNGDLDPIHFNGGFGYKGFSLRFMADRYHVTTRDVYDQALNRAVDNDFNSYLLGAQYNLKIGSRLSLLPRFNYKWQEPYRCVSLACREENLYFGKIAERVEGSLALSYDPMERVNFLAGGDFYQDRASALFSAPDYDLFENGQHFVHYTNGAFFAQGLVKTKLVDITVGGRVEHHSQAGNSFAPRFGLTKVKGKFHVKGLISRAFRAPGIANLLLNPEIKPERTTVMEFEAGYQITKDSILTGNVFNSRIKKPIVYSYDTEAEVEVYKNFTETGTRGFELDYRLKKDWGYINANYSHYRAIQNQVDYYSVDHHPELLLGFPAHKFTAAANIKLNRSFALNPSLVCLSSRYGYILPSESGETQKFDPVYLANLNFTWRNFASPGLDLDFGVFDILGENLEYIQPYKGLHAPLPGPSREYRVRLGYRWNYR
jgi:outer membrane receptor for ferrienterochelin and colicin